MQADCFRRECIELSLLFLRQFKLEESLKCPIMGQVEGLMEEIEKVFGIQLGNEESKTDIFKKVIRPKDKKLKKESDSKRRSIKQVLNQNS